jgi:hypothetical protein
MTSATRLWLLWQMGPGVGRRHVREGAPSLFAEDILRLGQVEGVVGMELVRLEKAGDLHPRSYDWMLVINLSEPEAQLPVEAFFDDLRSVGARPMMLGEAG